MTRTRMMLIGVVAAGFGAPALSQCDVELLHTLSEALPGEEFGTEVCGVGDVNGDGVPDLVIGSRYANGGGSWAGAAWVCSGVDGGVLYRWDGTNELDRFGAVGGAGDVNGDGYADVIVGAPGDDTSWNQAGSARVYSGLDGTVLHTWYGLVSHGLGGSVSGVGDMNGDGLDDVIVGVTGDLFGRASVYSGAGGGVLLDLHSPVNEGMFGYCVDGAGDVDGDGVPDVVVSNPFTSTNGSYSGSVYVHSGADGGELHAWHGDTEYDFFGESVAGAGDVDGDGLDDVIVGAANDGEGAPGSAYVYSGATGGTLHHWYGESPSAKFGAWVDGAGDVDGDGFDDLIVGAPGDNSGTGAAYLFSGRTGQQLHTAYGGAELDRMGASVAGAGDVNGDGLADVIVGVPGDDSDGEDAGAALVLVLDCACPADFNGDGVADTRDFVAYLNAWADEHDEDCSGGGCAADFNGDGVVDTRDFIEFLGVWAAGC